MRMRGIRPCLFRVVRPTLRELEKVRFIAALMRVQTSCPPPVGKSERNIDTRQYEGYESNMK
eukprot:5431334-Pyramimonas_sp.AAC.1